MLFIQRTHHYNCNSVDGVLKSGLIDDEPIPVSSIDQAFYLCSEALKGLTTKKIKHIHHAALHEEENGFKIVTGYFDFARNTISEQEYYASQDIELTTGGYRYESVTFEVCHKLSTEDAA